MIKEIIPISDNIELTTKFQLSKDSISPSPPQFVISFLHLNHC